MTPYFSSRDTAYRSPFGAVEEGTAVHFRLCLPREWRCCRAEILVSCAGKSDRQEDMFWAGQPDDSHEWWECHFTPDTAGVYRYGFKLTWGMGQAYLTACPDGTAAVWGAPGPRWQLTCYEKNFKTPDWLVGGVFYQIFPDRFHCSGKEKEKVPSDRILRQDWGGQPNWQPDDTGEIRNNDYFGGDLKGIEQKLDYLASLGVTCLYLNPIFEAHSNHRYDTADYEKIDPLLGNEKDFRSLMKAAKKRGIRVLLDGVFSHTGADSRYFNRYGRYGDGGAYRELSSPYYDWYHFRCWPEDYASWWGFVTLPETEELSGGFSEFITGKKGVVRRWMSAGASGWRLDVADELPDAFLDKLRQAVKAENPDGLLLGEVWEDASHKESYGHLRRYLLGRQLDSVMNYPFCNAILQYVCGGDSTAFYNTVEGIVENYPPQVVRLLMNHIGTHDTERALTVLGGPPAAGRRRSWQATQKLTEEERALGLRRLRLASLLQFCLPGVPCIYYGDEAGMEGYRDPFNRACFPWGQEDTLLLRWYQALGRLRKKLTPLKEGDFKAVRGNDDIVCFIRSHGKESLLCAVNRSREFTGVAVPAPFMSGEPVLGEGSIKNGMLTLPPLSGAVFAVGNSTL